MFQLKGSMSWCAPIRLPDAGLERHDQERLGARASKHTTISTYRLEGRGAVVPALALGAALGVAAGGNVRVVRLLAVGHDDDDRVGAWCEDGKGMGIGSVAETWVVRVVWVVR